MQKNLSDLVNNHSAEEDPSYPKQQDKLGDQGAHETSFSSIDQTESGEGQNSQSPQVLSQGIRNFEFNSFEGNTGEGGIGEERNFAKNYLKCLGR